MRGEIYQWTLIIAFVVAAALGAVFLYDEIFPQYKIFQDAFVELEKFRSQYTGEPPSPFKEEVKQLVFFREDKGPERVDRCISCHVALAVPDYSPTKIAQDLNGNTLTDAEGFPIKIPNDGYVWAMLDDKIKELEKSGNQAAANNLKALKSVEIDGREIDMSKVLSMHPLIGRETRPFEFHSMETYGCVECHNGNGRALTIDKAHGPVYDNQYDYAHTEEAPEFTEKDADNDPKFSTVFNHKPGHELLFQTTPLFVGGTIEAKCVQCHQTTSSYFNGVNHRVASLAGQQSENVQAIQKGIDSNILAIKALLKIREDLKTIGYDETLKKLKKESENLTLPTSQHLELQNQVKFVTNNKDVLEKKIEEQLVFLAGSVEAAQKISSLENSSQIEKFYEEHSADQKASLYRKILALNLQKEMLKHFQEVGNTVQSSTDQQTVSQMLTDVDKLTKTYREGEKLFISQACYACHRITGFSRGGVGPELTKEGLSYPWFVKESVVWPQADLRTSTMPNYRMDHEELEAIVTYLLAQRGKSKAMSDYEYNLWVKNWELGSKMPLEQPLPADKIHDLRNSMVIFATEGCAGCHRLEGYESNVGYVVEKDKKPDFDTLYKEKDWFQGLIPETISGSQLVKVLEEHGEEFDKRIADNIRENSILEEIETSFPKNIESLYANFKYASRAKDKQYKSDPKKLHDWKARVHRVLMVFIQEYGLGRLICPRLNWSGVFRSDKWLMDHFFNPTAETPKSIMPVFPFDETKFYALTYMLDKLGEKNRDAVHQLWEHKGFNPEHAFHLHCAQCHGDFRHGNGPVSEWIYPLPKNLTSAAFLTNLTKERAHISIKHGVKGTPMPPWGEVAEGKHFANSTPVLTDKEISELVDWLYSNIPTGGIIEQQQKVLKWQYTPEDVIKELQKEGGQLKSEEKDPLQALLEPFSKIEGCYAALDAQPLNEESDIEAVFDVVPAIIEGPENHSYYIKRKYYTPYNLEAGKQFFELNCAICHGKEADGTGLRAEAMQEAKPRMLTNLNWLDTRDDLRLLRSIKYGVPGTAMTPWGDQTSALQRIQLVIYIRSLTEQKKQTENLDSKLYDSFDKSEGIILNARSKEYAEIDKIESRLKKIKKEREELESKADNKALTLFQEELQLNKELKGREQNDQVYVNLINEVKKEKAIYDNLGLNLILIKADDKVLNDYLNLVALNSGRYHLEEGQLKMKDDPEIKEKMAVIESKIIKNIEDSVAELTKEKTLVEGKLPSDDKRAQLNKINSEIAALTKLRDRVVTDTSEAARIRKKQNEIYKNLKD